MSQAKWQPIEAMNLPTLNSARVFRDGGIDAVAALDAALADALVDAPQESHAELKLAIDRAMGAVLDATVNLAVRVYPELKPSEDSWVAIAKARAAARGAP
jgi:hypothetical protein